eukprot:SAG31_NODE_27964_length_417_cov_1.254717_1_plen_111_part_10
MQVVVGSAESNTLVAQVDDNPNFDYINDVLLLLYTVHLIIITNAYGREHVKESWYQYVVAATLWVVSIEAHLQHMNVISSHTFGWIQALQSLRCLWLIDGLNTSAAMRKLV